MAKRNADDTRAIHTDSTPMPSVAPKGSVKSPSANGVSQQAMQNGKAQPKTKNAATALSKNPHDKASVRAHIAKGNEHMLRGWQLIS